MTDHGQQPMDGIVSQCHRGNQPRRPNKNNNNRKSQPITFPSSYAPQQSPMKRPAPPPKSDQQRNAGPSKPRKASEVYALAKFAYDPDAYEHLSEEQRETFRRATECYEEKKHWTPRDLKGLLSPGLFADNITAGHVLTLFFELTATLARFGLDMPTLLTHIASMVDEIPDQIQYNTEDETEVTVPTGAAAIKERIHEFIAKMDIFRPDATNGALAPDRD